MAELMTEKDFASAWDTVVHIYEEGRIKDDPKTDIRKIIEILGLDRTMETFATVCAIMKHDGRISERNRKHMGAVNPECKDWYLGDRMDRIHPAHIDNLISALIEEVQYANREV